MSRSSQTIKALRQNFIHKQQLQDNCYNLQRMDQRDQFSDRQLFRSKEVHRKNGFATQGKIVTVQLKKMSTKDMTEQKKLQTQRQKGLKIICWKVPRDKSPTTLLPKQSQQNIRHNFDTIAWQPSLVKTQRVRRQVASARQASRNNLIPKYAAYLMKPCSVETIKIEKRPTSAFQQNRNDQSRKYSGFGLKRHVKDKPSRKLSYYFQPWETHEDDI